MVWIHGGAFVCGNGGYDTYSPDYIMGANVVYVGINYRVGILGFLNLDHEVAPGNMGLKDQVAALKWVRANISQFGGDPSNVTIFGSSAGGASVHYLLISPLAKETVDIARRYVAAFGKQIIDPAEIVEYLRTLSVQKLMEVQTRMTTMEDVVHLKFPFGPGVDDKSIQPFLPEPARELAAKGFDVPVIIGYCSHEGNAAIKNSYLPTEFQEKMFGKLDENFEFLVSRNLAAQAPSKVTEMAREMRKIYFGDKRITNALIDEIAQCYGDVHFRVGIHEVVETQRKKKLPTYFYRFSYDSSYSVPQVLMKIRGKGATHSEELQYLFYATNISVENEIKPDSAEEVMRNRMIRMWTNFAKTGNPTPSINDLITVKWDPISQTSKNYLEIDEQLVAGANPDGEMWESWKRIYAMADEQLV